MGDKPTTISMTAIRHHEHYDPSGLRVMHEPGDVYELADGDGMTAEELAASFVALKVAHRTATMTAKKPVKK